MAKRFSAGRKFGGQWGLSRMHSSKGTAMFKRLSPNKQKAWAAFDSKWSRRMYKKKGFF